MRPTPQETNVAISNFRKSIGKAIARERKRAGNVTQAEMGEKLGMEKESVSNMERGATSITIERLEELAEILGCPVRRFFWHDEGSVQEQAETIADMIQSLPPKRRPAIVRAVAEIVRALED